MLAEIEARIEAEAKRVGRDPADVRLIAVSKVQPNDRVAAVLEQGHRLFGENRVQEAAGKWPEFRSQFEGVESRPNWSTSNQQGPSGDGAV